jgi:16S rRNA (cytosine967-C5)-methyltransferase
MWWEELGADATRSLLAACNEPGEIAFRVDLGRSSREAMIESLAASGVEAAAAAGPWPLAAPESIVVKGRTGEEVPARVEAGELTPQSRGSAAIVEVLEPQPGEHVLDLCAGPGTKTGQIAARMSNRGETISIELDPSRAEEVAAQARRLGLRGVTVIETDAAELEMADVFDRILVDAPCSDLGALASRPDARWRKSPRGIGRLAELQDRILTHASRALRPGGSLVYSTCTISRRENEDRVAAVVAAGERGEAAPLRVEDLGALAPDLASPLDRRCLQVRPDRDRTTGFFISRLTRENG